MSAEPKQNWRKWYVAVLVCVVVYSCTKPKPVIVQDIPKAPYWYAATYTPKLNKSFTWSRYSYIGRWNNMDTTFYADTTISITVINDSTISFIGKTFQYVDSVYYTFAKVTYTTDTANVLVYADKEVQSPHSSSSIEYYYKTGEVRYSNCSGGRGGTSCIIYTTK